MCDHKKLHFGCNDCRSSVKFFDGEIDIHINYIRGIRDKLSVFIENNKLGGKTVNVIDECIDELDSAIKLIERETKALQQNIHGFSSTVK